MAHFLPGTPLYVTPGGHLTSDPRDRQRGTDSIGMAPVRPPAYGVLCEGPVRAGEMAYLIADDRVSATPTKNGYPVYVDSVRLSSRDGQTATVIPLDALDFTKDSIGTTKTRAVDIHTIACDDAPKEVDPLRWRAVVNTVFADCSEKSRTGDAYRRRHPVERDIAHDLLTIAPVVAAYAVARFVWGYDITSATADALARCKREDDPALTRYLVAYERA